MKSFKIEDQRRSSFLPARPLTARSKKTREAKRREVRLKNILDIVRLDLSSYEDNDLLHSYFS